MLQDLRRAHGVTGKPAGRKHSEGIQVSILGCPKNIAHLADLSGAAIDGENRAGCDGILVYDGESLSDHVDNDLLTQVRGLDGNASPERIGVGEITTRRRV